MPRIKQCQFLKSNIYWAGKSRAWELSKKKKKLLWKYSHIYIRKKWVAFYETIFLFLHMFMLISWNLVSHGIYWQKFTFFTSDSMTNTSKTNVIFWTNLLIFWSAKPFSPHHPYLFAYKIKILKIRERFWRNIRFKVTIETYIIVKK